MRIPKSSTALVAMTLVAALLGCSPSPVPSPPGTLAAGSSAEPGPPSVAAPSAPAPADAQWQALVEAARKEGKVVLHGPPTAEIRQKLPEAFKKAFGVDLEYVSIDTNESVDRVVRELSAGALTVDLINGGTRPFTDILEPRGLMEPIRPLLIIPDATNDKLWLRGKPWFVDKQDQFILRVLDQLSPIVAVSAKEPGVDAIKSAKDLLDPKWKGKIAMYDPTRPGPGMNHLSYLYKLFGEDFTVKLMRGQEVQTSSNRRQLADWLAQGRYPIVVAMSASELKPLVDDGFDVRFVQLEDVPTPEVLGFGAFVLLKGAPHPKAAQLFLNWINTKEALQLYSDLAGSATTRTDLDTSKLVPGTVPEPGKTYFDLQAWTYGPTEAEVRRINQRIKELFER